MRDLTELNEFRDEGMERRWIRAIGQRDRPPPKQWGFFLLPSPVDGAGVKCIASAGLGFPWDHVSVSREERCPWWEEMDFIARRFFRPSETAMQLHVPHTDHVNFHPYCLHLFRPRGMQQIPRPPSIMVGPDFAKGKAVA